MRLHEDKEKFRELIEYSAEYFGYNESKIEKDYWISTILKELSENKIIALDILYDIQSALKRFYIH